MEKFHYKAFDDLRSEIQEQGLTIPLSEDITPLLAPVKAGSAALANAMVILPMEGCDSTPSGAPDRLTRRRYLRFSQSGAAAVWFEAMAVCQEGRGNARQLYIGEETWESFRDLVGTMRKRTQEAGFPRQFIIAQLTHAGRYANPKGTPAPVLVEDNPILDAKYADMPRRIITDEELDALQEQFVAAAILARKAGYDAVDVKTCHRYLGSDLLSAFDRPGKYGGAYENRTRFLLETVEKIRLRVPDLMVVPRINGYDALPRPWGWGCDENGAPDLAEPKRLLRDLYDRGVRMVNISCGNPYYNPHVGRPFDNGPYIPPKTPLQSSAQMLGVISELQKSTPEMVVVCTGMTWFRQFGPNVAAGGLKEGNWRAAGFGRQAFAYPDFAADLIRNGALDPRKCCASCSCCTQIMRDHGTAGCVIQDRELYLPVLRSGRQGRPVPTPQVQCGHIP